MSTGGWELPDESPCSLLFDNIKLFYRGHAMAEYCFDVNEW